MPTTIADMLVTQLGALADQLAHVLPWVKHLTEDERAVLLADLSQACVHVRQTGDTQPLLDLLEDWEATAQVVRDEQLAAHLLAPINTHDYTP